MLSSALHHLTRLASLAFLPPPPLYPTPRHLPPHPTQPLSQEGPIHDVQWSPRGDYFVTVAGFMPAKSTLFTDKCVPKYDLGEWPPISAFFSCRSTRSLVWVCGSYGERLRGPVGRWGGLGEAWPVVLALAWVE